MTRRKQPISRATYKRCKVPPHSLASSSSLVQLYPFDTYRVSFFFQTLEQYKNSIQAPRTIPSQPSQIHGFGFITSLIGIMFEHKPLHLLQSSGSFASGDVTPPSRVATPLRQTPKSLRPYVYALMAFKHGRRFQTKPSTHHARRLSELASKLGPFAPALTVGVLLLQSVVS